MPSARGNLKRATSLRKARGKKVFQSQTKLGRRFIQLILFKVAVVLILVLGLGTLTKNLFSSWQNRVWIPKTRITVVVATEDPEVYSYNPQTGKLVQFTIPKNTQIETSGGYGTWPAGSLWELGTQEKKGGELLRASLQKSLGIPIDAYVEGKGEGLFKARALSFISSVWEAATQGSLKTNLTFFDRANLLISLGKTHLADRREIDLEGTGVINKKKLPDGEVGYTVITERSKIALESLRDDLVFAEGQKVVVANATGKGGLAGSVAQIGSVLGARVIGAQTLTEDIENCQIVGKLKDLESVTAKRLEKIFGCTKEVEENNSPANLQILLGKEFGKRF